MKIDISQKEYELIRESLESLFYSSKDEGDKRKMKSITKLEESLMNQAAKSE